MAHDFLTLQSVAEVLAQITSFSPLESDAIALSNGLGRVLLKDILATENIPPFPRSTMDGYAVRAYDVFGASEGLPSLLECIGECRMGEAPSAILEPGQTFRIWTGGMLPPGADAVVMVEYTQPAGLEHIEIMRPVAPLENIIEQGEDARQGSIVLPKGHTLRVQDLGILAALGIDTVEVSRTPRVAILSSGDEIVPVEVTPLAGQVRDINTHTLSAHARACGAETRFFGLIPDCRELLEAALKEALAWADIVLLSGGSSVGSRDFTLDAITSLPGSTILAHGVAISPGKPLIFAQAGLKSIFGLPGHVASALVCAEVFVRPMLQHLMGQPTARPVWEQSLRARLTRSVASAQGRRDYIRVALEFSGEADILLTARPIRGKSGLISTLVKADALVICPEELEGLEQGSVVPLLLLAGSWVGNC